ncbi:hypothetical protein GQ43DRAFT_439602 [Delitschia confertaspora ATCC 74209]|uniref:Condensation domain-containing protein n=1 Tax=Delitschia confertaspora ATCC 74209 TaxID=1513339 RepID=A0A9P4MR44_9PLEO|nr:hypothetical protein GQ43DRAFT_439602 [Delitschia confertaspora ATCC 74209]
MKFPWKETGPGRVERGLDSSERFLKAIAIPFKSLGRENWALNIILKVSLSTTEAHNTTDALRQAWVKTRYFHPFIATTIHLEEDKLEYITPDEKGLQKWLSESFFIHEDKTVEVFLLQAVWSEFSSFHYFPHSSEILMRTHHWLIDGMGGLHLANRFLELYAAGGPAPEFGDEIRFLPPCFVDAAGFPIPEEKDCAANRQAQEKFKEFTGNLPSIGLPIEDSPTGPGGTVRKHISFPLEKLDRILQACRAKGLTIGAVVHAALAVVTQEKAYKSDLAKKFTTVAFFDYRKYLPEPYNQVQQYPMGVWMLGLPFSLSAADFAAQAEACNKVYRQPVARDVFPTFNSYEKFCGMMADAFGAPPPPGLPLPSQPQLSNFGLVDGKIQRSYEGPNNIMITRVEPVLDSMETTPVVFQWSFNGTFYINACYNEKWHTATFMDSFLKRMGEVLVEGLGLT